MYWISTPRSELKISGELSAYLDLLRWMAALVVFTSHSNNFLFPNYKFGPFSWGREAVAVFFVLSGFVISYVVATKEKDWKTYLVARLSRIYPVVVIALLVTIAADAIGNFYIHSYYLSLENKFDGFYKPVSFDAAFSYLTFTNQIWFKHSIFGSNEVYWSLGFEVQYYIMFFIISFLSGKRRLLVLLLWGGLVGSNILLYLPLWLIGVLTFKLLDKNVFTSMLSARIGFVLPLIAIALLRFILGSKMGNMYKIYPLQNELINFLYYTGISLSVMVHILASDFLLRNRKIFSDRISKNIRWLAGGSFSLYLLHQPMLVLFSSFLQDNISISLRIFFFFMTLFLCYLLAECGERRKSFFSRRIFQPLVSKI